MPSRRDETKFEGYCKAAAEIRAEWVRLQTPATRGIRVDGVE
jgi:hypothetical protein